MTYRMLFGVEVLVTDQAPKDQAALVAPPARGRTLPDGVLIKNLGPRRASPVDAWDGALDEPRPKAHNLVQGIRHAAPGQNGGLD